MVVPIPEDSLWIQTGGLPIQPPKVRRRPNRPRKLQRKGADELVNGNVIPKKGTIAQYSNCNKPGHNEKTSKKPR